MKSYYDLSNKERAKLTYEELQPYLDVELMINGCVKVIPYESIELKKIPELTKKVWYKVGEYVFDSIEKANSFIMLSPYRSDYEYQCGYDYKYAEELDSSIQQVYLYEHKQLNEIKDILIFNKQAKEKNDKLTSEYNKKSSESTKIFDGIYLDWNSCKDHIIELEKVYKTYLSYLGLTNGDENIAHNFLKKVFSDSVIEESKNTLPELWA